MPDPVIINVNALPIAPGINDDDLFIVCTSAGIAQQASGALVKAWAAAGGGGGTTLDTPTLTATAASDTQIDLSWTNVANESSFKLEWSPNGTTGWTQIGGTIAANTLVYSHTGLTASTLYYYRVSAIGDGVTYLTSGFGSDNESTTAPGLIPLSTPGSFAATVISSTQIDLSWTDVANESSYRLDWSPNGSSGWTQIGGTIAAGSTSYSHTGLTASTAYYYRLKAVGDGVTYSDSSYATDNDTTSGAYEAVDWVDPTANFVEDTLGGFHFTSFSSAIGARASKKLTGGWSLLVKLKTPASDSGLVWLFLSSVNDTAYSHNDSGVTGIVGGFTTYLGDLARNTGPTTENTYNTTIGSSIVTDGMWILIERVSDDLLYHSSPDGVTFTLRSTDTNAVAGVTDVFIKAMNGAAGVTDAGFEEVKGLGLVTI
jgi:hypothetical protein